ncbi:MAG: hypothetical protein KF784_00905 [Fimbriimonadaceae bacterium]|nr:hypothetical protein [Fimbriimonadaceae bacterium]
MLRRSGGVGLEGVFEGEEFVGAVGDQRSAIRNQLSAIGYRLSEIRDQKSAIGDQKSAIGYRLSAIGDQRSEIRNQLSAIGGRRSEIVVVPFHLLLNRDEKVERG